MSVAPSVLFPIVVISAVIVLHMLGVFPKPQPVWARVKVSPIVAVALAIVFIGGFGWLAKLV